jgi:hypothetical protein
VIAEIVVELEDFRTCDRFIEAGYREPGLATLTGFEPVFPRERAVLLLYNKLPMNYL